MHIHLAVWAIALSLASFATGQSSGASFPPAASSAFPSPSNALPIPIPAISGSAIMATPSVWYPSSDGTYSEDNTIHKGPIIGAAIGGSVAASLAVVLAALFCFRYRARRTHMVSIGGAMDNNTARYNDLESQVVALRADVDRLVGLQQMVHTDGSAVMYTNEKDAEAEIKKGTGAKGKKEALPTYAD
ncbi:hypothetical protein C8R43DRAFT_942860 [Mycena crocata]|nr:hypothetical protein C8R43DRAFT_942860 [Mycena crocata]